MEMEDYILYTCVHCKTKIANYDSIVDHFEQFHEKWNEQSQSDESDEEDESDVENEEGDDEFEEYLKHDTNKICGICKTSFHSFRQADILNHLIVNHKYYYGVLEIYKCKICDKKFAYKKRLEDHFMSIHGMNAKTHYFKITIRRCGLCRKDFTSSKLLENHFTNSYRLKKVI